MARLRVLQQALHLKPLQKFQRPLLCSLTSSLHRRSLSTTCRLLKYTYPEIPEEDEPFIVKSPYSEVEIPEVNLADFVWKDVEKWPERTALVCGMTGREYTYEMAHNMSKKFGSALLRMGAKKGDVLCMVVPNIPEFPIAFFGAAGVGVTLTTMNPTYRPGKGLSLRNLIMMLTLHIIFLNYRGDCSSIRKLRSKVRFNHWIIFTKHQTSL